MGENALIIQINTKGLHSQYKNARLENIFPNGRYFFADNILMVNQDKKHPIFEKMPENLDFKPFVNQSCGEK